MEKVKTKKQGFSLDIRTFNGKDGGTYLVFQAWSGAFHVFREVEAKAAAKDCGASSKGNTRQMWQELWNKKK